MTVLVDTSVWSLLFRKGGPASLPEVDALRRLLGGGDRVATTGVIVQELLFGLGAGKALEAVETRLRALLYLAPTLDDHAAAARLGRALRSSGIQLSGVDALIAHLCISRDATLLSTDQDFIHAARKVPLRLWAQRG